ncbi:phage holin [Priestia megaterium]|uniref:phage holin n=1 Tax=Priestia megaterium TaxID=1404 RepID=UPI003CFD64C2
MTKLKRYFKRRRNATFYITSLAQLLIAIQLILAIFNADYLLDTVLQNKILSAANGLCVVLGTFGVLNDPKEPGVGDKEE